MWKKNLFTMWFQDFVTVFNQSYNCQTSHCLGRNRPPNARLSILLFDPCLLRWINNYRVLILVYLGVGNRAARQKKKKKRTDQSQTANCRHQTRVLKPPKPKDINPCKPHPQRCGSFSRLRKNTNTWRLTSPDAAVVTSNLTTSIARPIRYVYCVSFVLLSTVFRQ